MWSGSQRGRLREGTYMCVSKYVHIHVLIAYHVIVV